VVPYRDGTDPEDKLTEPASDIETGEDSKTYIAIAEKDAEQKSSIWEPVLADATPFFHIDLTSAVRVAERGLNRVRTLKVVKTVQSAD
jgi:sodium-independent sulfate anion transporter 11